MLFVEKMWLKLELGFEKIFIIINEKKSWKFVSLENVMKKKTNALAA